MPASFLDHFAVQGGDWGLAWVNTAAGKLVFRYRLCLMRQQDRLPMQQNGINARATAVGLPGLDGLAVATDHDCPLVGWLP